MKYRAVVRAVLLGVMIMILGVGCAGQQTQKSEAPAAAPPAAESNIVGNPPAGSGFSKIKIGMTSGEVRAILGKPDDEGRQMTAKVWIPFNFGGQGTQYIRYNFKGQGRIFFENESHYSDVIRVVRVEYDPTDPGYAR